MLTPWTSQVSPSNALPLYPRPRLARTDWLNLNGLWEFMGASSLSSPPMGKALPESVLVPYPVESALSRIARHEHYMWYRRLVSVPSAWLGLRVHLNFGAVNWHATVWVNGKQVGQHTGAYDAFSFDVTDALRAGENELLVGVYSPVDDLLIPVGKQRLNPAGIFYTASSGIWQTVWLEPTDSVHITGLEVRPDVFDAALELTVHATASTPIHAVVSAAGQAVGSGDGVTEVPLRVSVPNSRVWSPSDPFLYDLVVSLREGPRGDTVSSYFGMRSVSQGVVDGVLRPLLNGEFTFQIGALDQGYWPDGLYTAPTDEALMFDLQQQKALGFNTVRKHMKVEPARWYYWADKLGLLVWQDMPALPLGLAEPPLPSADGDFARGNFEDELARIVTQLREVTSIIQWQPFNEGWGAYDQRRLVALVKALDATRPVDIDSGGNDHGFGDRVDRHLYPGPGLPQPPEAPTADAPLGQVAVLGEYGALGLIIPGHEWEVGQGFTLPPCPMEADAAALTSDYVARAAGVRRLIPLSRGSGGLSASIYTQITDVENERNGIWTYDREVLKVNADMVRTANLAVQAATTSA